MYCIDSARLLVLLIALSHLLCAQDGRTVTSGVVLDHRDEAWASAHVVFAARVLKDDRGSAIDIVRVRADRRGRFRAKLRVGRAYDAWAYECDDRDRRRVSQLASGCVASRRVILKEAWQRDSQVIRIREREDWRALGVARCRVMLDASSLYTVSLAADADGRMRIPPLPPGRRILLFENARGALLAALSIDAGGCKIEDGVAVFDAPRVAPILVRVVGLKSKAGIAGVSIKQRVGRIRNRDLWATVGESGEGGWASLIARPYFGAKTARQYYWFRVSGADAGLSFGGKSLDLDPKRDIRALRASESADITIKANTPSLELRGRLLLNGRVCAQRSVVVFSAVGSLKSTSFYLNYPANYVRTDAAGHFRVGGLSPRAPLRLVVPLSPEEQVTLSTDRTFPVAPFAVVASTAVQGDCDLGNLHLDDLARVEIRLSASDSFPSAATEVYVGEYGRQVPLRYKGAGLPLGVRLRTTLPLSFVTDRRGRAAVLLPRENALSIASVRDGAVVTAPALFPPAGDSLGLNWRFPETMRLRGRVLNADGSPVAGCRILAYPSRYPKGFDTRLSSLIVQAPCFSDASGRFSVGLGFAETPYHVSASLATPTGYRTARLQVVTDEDSVDPADLEIRLRGIAAAPRKRLLAFRPVTQGAHAQDDENSKKK